jgi:hypothetical protein
MGTARYGVEHRVAGALADDDVGYDREIRVLDLDASRSGGR